MRIIAGSHRGRVIRPPNNLPVRPTTDMAKESLFNILRNLVDFEGVSAMDLFSGTGSIAFELISRGCEQVVAVDQNRSCADWIRKAAGQFGMNNLSVQQSDSFKFIARSFKSFDVIFADPPYDMENIEDLPDAVFNSSVLKPEGLLVIEHSRRIDFTAHPHFFDHRKYGKVNFTFFK
ncbi:MAG: 16S rRNA (guanine(966)-N(2))-methyltransferase RsmD [Bacteroidales bacterium]|nr:16S rRNA (guanine(966)-N(2))-methyltransferase RsmD [Bacteroidales bacterium]